MGGFKMAGSFLKLTGSACALAAVLGLAAAMAATAQPATGCKPGTTCLTVASGGAAGTGFTAQCSGRFPDFVFDSTKIPSGFAGPWFVSSQNFPTSAPTNDAPWLKINFKAGTKGANDYLYALRDYAFAGMIDADFRPENNAVRQWFHMPMMTFGPRRREPMRGMTSERVLSGGELGLKPGQTVHNYAVGFYNQVGAVAIGNVWKTANPDLTKSRFAKGTMTFKILFSEGRPDQFTSDPMAGAPEMTILTDGGPKTVRLLQMDVAAVDPNSLTGWVFGTFAFDPTATDPVTWNRLRPVGLSWGNDPGIKPSDIPPKKLKQTTISDQVPAYAATHLGWAGRANGPVDNPISGCLSCHGTAQYPVAANIFPKDNCDDKKRLFWFRNFKGDKPFGAIDDATCLPKPPAAALTPLDFSLQMQVAVQSVKQFNNVNPCTPPAPAAPMAATKQPPPTPPEYQNAPRVER
jgi:hypothetical protein